MEFDIQIQIILVLYLLGVSNDIHLLLFLSNMHNPNVHNPNPGKDLICI